MRELDNDMCGIMLLMLTRKYKWRGSQSSTTSEPLSYPDASACETYQEWKAAVGLY